MLGKAFLGKLCRVQMLSGNLTCLGRSRPRFSEPQWNLLYGAETWTLKKADTRALDGVYTRMLRMVFGISWKSHTPYSVLYGNIPPVTDTIKTQRLRFAGHVYRLQDQPAQQLLFRQPNYGHRYRGRPH